MGENADLVRRTLEFFNARDAEGIVALMDPDGELYPYAIDESRGEGYHGHDGLRKYVADVDGLFASFEVEVTEVKDVTEDTVVARGKLHGVLKSGDPLEMDVGWLWTVRDGKLTRMQAHPAD